MSDGVAFRSSALDVIEAWDEYQAYNEQCRDARKTFMDKYDRTLMVRRDWDHGTRVVGFAPGREFDGKLLRLERGALVPRLSSKAGKALAAELAPLKQDGIKLPGMPQWVITGGLHINAPALFEHEGTVWAHWPADIAVADPGDCQGSQVDPGLWEKQPLSAYYAVKEARQAVSTRG